MSEITEANLTGASIAIAGGWALKKVLGPTLGLLGEDLSHLYAAGRDKIVKAATNKIPDIDDQASANLRVARELFWSGSFSQEDICAEYFGGILAGSRSPGGTSDSMIYYLDVIKSLSSYQMLLHYLIYNALNKLLVKYDVFDPINPAKSPDVEHSQIWLDSDELESFGIDVAIDITILFRCGLICEAEADVHRGDNGDKIGYTKVHPTSFGIQIYAVAFNRLDSWLLFPNEDFGSFADIPTAKIFGRSMDDLLRP